MSSFVYVAIQAMMFSHVHRNTFTNVYTKVSFYGTSVSPIVFGVWIRYREV